MNGRLYDPVVGRFLSPDNYVQMPDFSQNFNRYSYCLNNPLMYTDPSGEIIWLVPALIGGVINVAANWKSIDNFWQGLGYFGAGAVQGGLAVLGPVGWLAGGAIAGGVNAGLQGGNVLQGMTVGGFSGLIGGSLGSWAGQHLGGVVINGFNVSANSAIGGLVTGSIGGAVGGYAGGFTAGFMMTGDLS